MKKRRKEREKKEGIYKKGECERKGMRVSQLALHTSKAILCARLQAVALHFSRKTFRHLAPPNLALTRLQSLAVTLIRCQLCIASLAAPMHAKEEECSSYDPGLCYSTLIGTCSYAQKRRRTLHLESQSIVPTDQATMVHGFYTLAVCTT